MVNTKTAHGPVKQVPGCDAELALLLAFIVEELSTTQSEIERRRRQGCSSDTVDALRLDVSGLTALCGLVEMLQYRKRPTPVWRLERIRALMLEIVQGELEIFSDRFRQEFPMLLHACIVAVESTQKVAA